MATSVNDFITALSQIISVNNDQINIQKNSVVSDGWLAPSANALYWKTSLNDLDSTVQSLDSIIAAKQNDTFLFNVAVALNLSYSSVLALLSRAIDRKALDSGLTRKTAAAANGYVQFYAYSVGSTDLEVPSGTTVETPQGVQYTTNVTTVLAAASSDRYYDPTLGAYALSVPVTAAIAGAASNVSAGLLTVTPAALPSGFDGVTNSSDIANGIDAETDEQFVDRIKSVVQGMSRQSNQGLKGYLTSNTGIRFAYVAGADSPYQFRNQGMGGCVDVYVKGEIPAKVSNESITFSSGLRYALQKRPVLNILSVTGTSSGSPKTFTQDVDYRLVSDPSRLTWGSYLANDRLVWLEGNGAVWPDSGTDFLVTYTYNQQIELAQNILTSDDVKPLMGKTTDNVLVREGEPRLANISFQVYVDSTKSRDAVLTAAKTAVQTYIYNLDFGESISQLDIIQVISAVDGVTAVNTVPVAFTTEDDGITRQEITALPYQYVWLNSLDLF